MQACGTIEKACVEQCTAGGTLPTATAAEPRTSPVPAPSSTAHGTGSHTAEAFSYDDHTFAVLAEHFRFSAAVPGVPCVRITSDCKATSSFAKCVASCVKARKPHGPGAAHCRGKSGGAQSHRHSDARWAGPCSRCGQRAPTSTARAGPLWIKNVARPATAHPPRSPSLLDGFQLHSHRSGCGRKREEPLFHRVLCTCALRRPPPAQDSAQRRPGTVHDCSHGRGCYPARRCPGRSRAALAIEPRGPIEFDQLIERLSQLPTYSGILVWR